MESSDGGLSSRGLICLLTSILFLVTAACAIDGGH